MDIKNFMNDLAEAKHKRVNIYFLNSQKLVKGFLKNVTGDLDQDEDKFLDISLQEIKSDDHVLEKYKCKKKGKGSGKNNNDRITVELRNLEDITQINRTVTVDTILYKLSLDSEEIGILIYTR